MRDWAVQGGGGGAGRRAARRWLHSAERRRDARTVPQPARVDEMRPGCWRRLCGRHRRRCDVRWKGREGERGRIRGGGGCCSGLERPSGGQWLQRLWRAGLLLLHLRELRGAALLAVRAGCHWSCRWLAVAVILCVGEATWRRLRVQAGQHAGQRQPAGAATPRIPRLPCTRPTCSAAPRATACGSPCCCEPALGAPSRRSHHAAGAEKLANASCWSCCWPCCCRRS